MKKIYQPSKYSRLLIVLVLVLLAGSLLEESEASRIILALIILSKLIVTVEDFTVDRRKLRFYRLLVAIGFALDMIRLLWLSPFSHWLLFARNTIYFAFLAMAIVAIFKDIWRAKRVNNNLLQGGVCIYLLAAGLWAMAYQNIALFDPQAFYLSVERKGFHSYIYFSFVTLTTSGYGDIVPVNKLAILLASLEAVFGTLFLTIVIARLVSLYTVEQEERD